MHVNVAFFLGFHTQVYLALSSLKTQEPNRIRTTEILNRKFSEKDQEVIVSFIWSSLGRKCNEKRQSNLTIVPKEINYFIKLSQTLV